NRVLAYAAMSQIGYMFLGAGLGAYANGMFHLMTHAFFKALLFMAAGLVIHALAGEQDLRKMGGLRTLLPRTYWAFAIGALALAGMPPFSGFFSKDSILAAALANGGWLQCAGIWTPVSDWLEPVAPALVDASSVQEVISSIVAVVLGLAGIGVAWWIYGARRGAAPRSWRPFERKFWFDEIYDALF